MEEYRKILIIDDYDSEMFDIINFVKWSLKIYTSSMIQINESVIVIDTYHSIPELELEFPGFDVILIDITDINLYGLVKEEWITPILNAKKEMDISEDINYFLDLIQEKGGIEKLTDKEFQRLKQLSSDI
jgi:hypothetical protein